MYADNQLFTKPIILPSETASFITRNNKFCTLKQPVSYLPRNLYVAAGLSFPADIFLSEKCVRVGII